MRQVVGRVLESEELVIGATVPGHAVLVQIHELGYVCQYARSAKRRGRKPTALSPAAIHLITVDNSDGQEGSGIGDSHREDATGFEPTISLRESFSYGSPRRSRQDEREGSSPIGSPSAIRTFSSLETTATRGIAQSHVDTFGSPPQLLERDIPSEKIHRVEKDGNCPGPSSTHRYTILEPILPLLANSVEPDLACALLEYYFKAPGAKTHLISASPYVLSHVLRRKSLLRAANPRLTSPALLVTLLWVSAQTADPDAFLVPGRRQRVCKHLRNLAIYLIYISDQHHRHDRTRGVMSCRACSREIEKVYSSAYHESDNLDNLFKFQNSLDQPRNRTLDDVLTFVLFTIVVSSGDRKADCHIWWTRALNASRMLRISEEQYTENGCNCKSGTRTKDHVCYSGIRDFERREERRRVFWLLFSLDRHLALSFNLPLNIADSECRVFHPLRDHDWENIEKLQLHEVHLHSTFAPPTHVTGTGFFEFFLPLMTILGNVIDLHRLQEHSTFGSLHIRELVMLVEDKLADCAASIRNLADNADIFTHDNSSDTPTSQIMSRSDEMLDGYARGNVESQHLVKLVSVYSTFILHVLYVLLHGKWDALAMIDNHDDWIGSEGYLQCTSHAIEASEAISRLLESDPELSFMPYLLGIYLLQESFIILLFADRMPQVGLNESVKKACETIIRAHEVCVVTLNTEFQRRFRKVLRSTLCRVSGSYVPSEEEDRSKRKALMVYRWIPGGNGLGL